MKIKTVAAALMLALGAMSAQAATYNLSNPLNPVAQTGSNWVSGSFADILNFQVANPFNLVAGAVMDVPLSFTFPNGGFSITLPDITGLTAALYSGHNASGSSLASQGPGDYLSLSGVLNAGSYSLKITGTGTGQNGAGLYTYTAFAQAVPEPESYAMFLAGLGLMGFIARRRSRQV